MQNCSQQHKRPTLQLKCLPPAVPAYTHRIIIADVQRVVFVLVAQLIGRLLAHFYT
eukprot:SAG11_NODE_6672_length_1270_cov_1.055508_1_plen_55_part_10